MVLVGVRCFGGSLSWFFVGCQCVFLKVFVGFPRVSASV